MLTIALDSHKRYSQVSVETMEGQIVKEGRIVHQPGAIAGTPRDFRELPRVRMILSQERTRLKNRIHSALEKYGLICGQTELSDLFGKAGRQ